MSDTWKDIQEFKKRQSTLREKFQQRKKVREEIVQCLAADLPPPPPPVTVSLSAAALSPASSVSSIRHAIVGDIHHLGSGVGVGTGQVSSPQQQPLATSSASVNTQSLNDLTLGNISVEVPQQKDEDTKKNFSLDPLVERRLLQCLCEVSLNLPTDSRALLSTVTKALQKDVLLLTVENLLQKFAAQELINIKEGLSADGKSCIVVTGAEHTKLTAVANDLDAASGDSVKDLTKSTGNGEETLEVAAKAPSTNANRETSKRDVESIESLLSLPSTREKENKKMGEEILDLLSKPTAKERSLVESFRSQGGAQVKEFCPQGTKEECVKLSGTNEPCRKLHFKKIIQKHTDESLGDCSFLNTCFHMDTCKYVHYEVDHSALPSQEKITKPEEDKENVVNLHETKPVATLSPPQWIQCDLRYFDMTILGKFAVVMADPPWDIHMELPYGTMSDNEMRQLNIPALQEEGLIFLWVTGRAMELGRECLKLWGYERCDELIWVKTNQLQRIIRTGRTGHWLNHGKEHCLVGMKGAAATINRGLDCDVIVAEVRATSHKPDEIYGIIERLSPGTRKIELFGRPHNVQPNWITLGNQLDGVRILDPDMVRRFEERYPDGNCMAPPVLLSKS